MYRCLRLIVAGYCFCCFGTSPIAWAQLLGQGGVPYAQLGPRPGIIPQAGAVQPHPAVVRIIVPERDGTSYGSGTLVDVREQYGLIVTNWHVVRDAADRIEVVFPDGFRSYGQALKIDKDWDLAALVIWKPNVAPVPLASAAPQPGDVLTIAGYGKGTYRSLTGRCTQYLSPTVQLPREMVEVSVAARQGDSGGPIFNTRGELAGVLWGAGSATTLGSYAGRVGGFLASVAPDIGVGPTQPQTQIAARLRDAPPIKTPLAGNAIAESHQVNSGTSASPYANLKEIADSGLVAVDQSAAEGGNSQVSSYAATVAANATAAPADDETREREPAPNLSAPVFRTEFAAKSERTGNLPPSAAIVDGDGNVISPDVAASPADSAQVIQVPLTWQDIAGESYFDQAKTIMAALGVFAVAHFFMKNARS